MYDPREAQKDFLYQIQVVAIMVLLIAAGFTAWSFRNGLQYALLSNYAHAVTGTIVQIERRPYASAIIDYVFDYPDGTPHSGRFLAPRPESVDYIVGREIVVLYFPPYREIFQIEDRLPAQKMSFYMLIISILAMLGMFALVVYSAFRIVQHREESQHY